MWPKSMYPTSIHPCLFVVVYHTLFVCLFVVVVSPVCGQEACIPPEAWVCRGTLPQVSTAVCPPEMEGTNDLTMWRRERESICVCPLSMIFQLCLLLTVIPCTSQSEECQEAAGSTIPPLLLEKVK